MHVLCRRDPYHLPQYPYPSSLHLQNVRIQSTYLRPVYRTLVKKKIIHVFIYIHTRAYVCILDTHTHIQARAIYACHIRICVLVYTRYSILCTYIDVCVLYTLSRMRMCAIVRSCLSCSAVCPDVIER